MEWEEAVRVEETDGGGGGGAVGSRRRKKGSRGSWHVSLVTAPPQHLYQESQPSAINIPPPPGGQFT